MPGNSPARSVLQAAAAIVSLVFATSLAADDDVPSVDEARRQVIARLLKLQNIIVEYEQTDTLQPVHDLVDRDVVRPFGSEGVGRVNLFPRGSEESTCRFRFLSGLAWYEQRVTEARPGLPGYIRSSIVSFGEDHLERLTQQEDNLPTTLEPLIGEIDAYPQQRVPEPSEVIDIALGLRLPRTGANWQTPEDIRQYSFDLLEDGRVVVTNRQFNTYTIEDEERTSIENNEWVFDAQQDYALVRYRRLVNQELDRELAMTTFDMVDGIPLPTEIRFRSLYKHAGPPIETHVIEIQVTLYELNSSENTPESFAIEFPENAVVLQDD